MRRFPFAILGLSAAAALTMGFLIVNDDLHGQPPNTQARSGVEPSIPREVVIGEWEDTIGSWTQRIRIVERAGLLLREIHLPDGRVDRDILSEVTPQGSEERRFENPSSQRGQAYSITRYGQLAIYDDDGFVGVAINVTTKGD